MTADRLIGKQAGNYRLVERLGAGGMGEVYKAVHVSIGSKVAIKVLRATAARDRALQERFNLEAQAVNRIDHAGIVKVIDAGRMDAGLGALSLNDFGLVQRELDKAARPPRAKPALQPKPKPKPKDKSATVDPFALQ